MEQPVAFDLDIIGVLEGTDKSSSVTFCWDYLRHYQTLFAPWRDQPINFIEIGVQNGPSLNVWTTYFSRARIVGIDIDPNCRRLARERVAIEIGSQEDPGFLHRVCAKYPPTILVDDGSHQAHHIVHTFRRCFPMLEAGGLYVVEDLQFHFGGSAAQWAGNKTVSATDYFLDLARARMANGEGMEEVWGDDRYIRDHVDSVTFIGSAVAIRKKQPRDIQSALLCAGPYLQSINATSAHLLRLADYILKNDGPLDYAEHSIRGAVALGGHSAEELRLLVGILTRQRRFDEAARATNEATNLRPDDHTAWGWHGRVEQGRGNDPAAIEAFEKAAALNPGIGDYHDNLSHLYQRTGNLARSLASARAFASLHPNFAPSRRRVEALETLAAAAGIA